MMATRPLYAAVDLGSNSFHLLLARGRSAALAPPEIVYRTREKVRLAAGLNHTMVVSESAIARGESCLQKFAEVLQGIPIHHSMCVATATLRKASNQTEILARFEQALGRPIEIISGEREAELIYQGAIWQQVLPAKLMVIDIGGASTEVIVGRGIKAEQLHSFDMGCVTYQQQFFATGAITASACEAAIEHAQAALAPWRPRFCQLGWHQVMGASGTFKALEELLLAGGKRSEAEPSTLSADFIETVLQRCIAQQHLDQLHLPGLRTDRKAVLLGGLCILVALVRTFQLTNIQLAAGALREGLLHHLTRTAA